MTLHCNTGRIFFFFKVLMDTSSSMEEECYGELKIRKIDAVKELFDSFATRTMAYDFHHVIGLVRFNSNVKLIHTFTETLEKFKVGKIIILEKGKIFALFH